MKHLFTTLFLLTLSHAVLYSQDEDTRNAASLHQTQAATMHVPVPGDTATSDSSHWKLHGLFSVNGQQVSLTNWSAGGQNSISVGGIINFYAGYKKGKIIWDNTANLAYGVIRQGTGSNWWKNDDRIQLTSTFGREAAKHWYYSALVDFKTQFAPGYNYPNDSVRISNFMAPGYVVASLGMDYKPNDNFTLFISPVTGKFTFVNDDSLARVGAFGVQKQIVDSATGVITQHYLTHREEFGAYVKMQYKVKLMENVTFQTMVELFSNYMHHPENIDVNWTTLTTFKVNRFISATVTTQLVYDDDISVLRTGGSRKGTMGPDVQFKEVLALGFSYKF